MLQIIIDLGNIELFGWTIPLRIPSYGLMIAMGFLIGIFLARRRGRRMGENPDHVTNCGMLALIGGIVGARAAYVIQHWEQFSAPGEAASILNFTSGGLIYYGGLILGMLLVLGYLSMSKLPPRRFLDIMAVSMMVGLVFGRAGCLLNGCCYGSPTHDSALSMRFPMFSQPLVNFNGSDNPYSIHAEGASPVYEAHFAAGLVHPDERLLSKDGSGYTYVLPPRYLHARLDREQMSVMLLSAAEAQELFNAAAGIDGRIGPSEWRTALARGDGFLRGSENWHDAIGQDLDGDGRLNFMETWEYLQLRRVRLLARFDADGNRSFNDAERAAADEYLRADLFALAAAEKSLPVRPAQALGIVNALLLAGILAVFYRMRSREGQVFALLLILYPITRFILELIRDDNAHNILKGVLTHNQYTSLLLAAVGVVMWMVLRKLPPSAGPTWSQRVAETAHAGRNQRTGRERKVHR